MYITFNINLYVHFSEGLRLGLLLLYTFFQLLHFSQVSVYIVLQFRYLFDET